MAWKQLEWPRSMRLPARADKKQIGQGCCLWPSDPVAGKKFERHRSLWFGHQIGLWQRSQSSVAGVTSCSWTTQEGLIFVVSVEAIVDFLQQDAGHVDFSNDAAASSFWGYPPGLKPNISTTATMCQGGSNIIKTIGQTKLVLG
ncbi:hypothetical protein E2562_004908 [Oryza meyeriana var. granulata]|uniref:Uncharacterized protein n=1 Tax=Oryza meyeriana var. granulata TaxID=110450 RepID=A0A6G1C377_9ORYZ|nr:hypothetical protein E2562_004908 [Oryza meyeriana var. granulata]